LGSRGDGGRGSVQDTALDRALSLLEALVDLAEPGSLAEVAAAARMPKPTAHRILATFVTRGYARQRADGRYEPGTRILGLAGRVQERLDLATFARPAMRVLQTLLPETVHFAVLEHSDIVYIEKLEGRRAFRMTSRVGMSVPLHCTAIGKSALAYLSAEECFARLGPEPYERRTPRTITRWADLQRELAEVVERGYAIDNGENEEDIRCVGAAVFDHQGGVMGGLSLSAAAFALPLDEARSLGPAVVAAAAAVSLGLGVRPEHLPGPFAAASEAARLDQLDALVAQSPRR
jgi:IclR family acetate operon transcriptional repressor